MTSQCIQRMSRQDGFWRITQKQGKTVHRGGSNCQIQTNKTNRKKYQTTGVTGSKKTRKIERTYMIIVTRLFSNIRRHNFSNNWVKEGLNEWIMGQIVRGVSLLF